jgi:hypothetical protein
MRKSGMNLLGRGKTLIKDLRGKSVGAIQEAQPLIIHEAIEILYRQKKNRGYKHATYEEDMK